MLSHKILFHDRELLPLPTLYFEIPGAQMGVRRQACFTNVDRTVHISTKAVEPPGEAKSDLEMFLDCGKRMGFKDKDDAA